VQRIKLGGKVYQVEETVAATLRRLNQSYRRGNIGIRGAIKAFVDAGLREGTIVPT